jgi:hypothetical protein
MESQDHVVGTAVNAPPTFKAMEAQNRRLQQELRDALRKVSNAE